MKKIFVFLLLMSGVCAVFAQNGPAASPASSVSCDVGLTKISINYSRPSIKGRKIFGDGSDFLVPYGKIWRTGANAGTRISFSDDVKVEGQIGRASCRERV